jgi:superfamily II DNA or RNA helicase
MYIPWDYQEPGLKKLRHVRRVEKKKTALLVMACGLGKTAMAAFDVRDFLRSLRNGRVLYLCDQNSILKKSRTTFKEIIGGDLSRFGFYHGFKKDPAAQFLFASFQTMAEHHREFKRDAFDYIIVDEAHHTSADTYLPVVKWFRPQFLLGITATPDREDDNDIRDVFGPAVFRIDLPEALAKGYLTPVEYLLMADSVVQLGKIENPYRLSMKELNRTIFVPKRDEEIVRLIRKKCVEEGLTNPRMIVFCHSIVHAERFAKHLKGSLTIHSGMRHDEQEERETAFRSGRATALVTVDKFNEGVDIPEVDVVVFLRSTESSIIFYQQLGRGLRKKEGKKKVLAFDFVGNCERIRLVQEFQQELEQWRERASSEGGGGAVTPTTFNYGTFVFTEQVKNIIALLDKVQGGYTPEILIAQLQNEAKRLGRTPMIPDVNVSSQAGRTASVTTFGKAFGSWNDALTAAGFETNVTRYDKTALIAQFQAEAKRLEKKPSSHEITTASQAGRTASTGTFLRAFGSWGELLEAAGLGANKDYDKKTLIAQLQAEGKLLGRAPTSTDVMASSKARRTASNKTFLVMFGSWNDALTAAGFKVIERDNSREGLIAQLQSEAKRLRRTPFMTDMDVSSKACRTATGGTFMRVFGSWNDALLAAGLEINRARSYTKEALVTQLQNEAKRLGRTPTQPHIIRASKEKRTANVKVFIDEFGSWNEALTTAGLEVNIVHGDFRPKTLIAELRAEAKRLGRTPNAKDINLASKEGRTASLSKFGHVFGSHNKAIEAARLKVNKKSGK